MIDGQIVVTDWHFSYLRLQKGKLEPLAGSRERWHEAYERDLWGTYAEMRPHLPERCSRVLDVGSGLGGIDILLYRHYEGMTGLTLLDGANDPPVMEKHAKTFSNAAAARDFMFHNNVNSAQLWQADPNAGDVLVGGPLYDLVVSFGSWCFHYAPAVYLERVIQASHPATVFVLDVRRDKGEWTTQLLERFREVASIRVSAKFARGVYAIR